MSTKIQHLRTSGNSAPSSSILEFGEIAIAYKSGNESLFIKNSDNDVISFATRNEMKNSVNDLNIKINSVSATTNSLSLTIDNLNSIIDELKEANKTIKSDLESIKKQIGGSN